MGVAFIYKIIVIVTAICLVILTIPYWIALNYSADHHDWVWVVLDALSAIFMIILAIIGIVGALKPPGRLLLLIYAIGMIAMFIFILIQLIINLIEYQQCDDRVAYLFICNYDLGKYLPPTIIMMIITLVGGIAAILLRREIEDDSKASGKVTVGVQRASRYLQDCASLLFGCHLLFGRIPAQGTRRGLCYNKLVRQLLHCL